MMLSHPNPLNALRILALSISLLFLQNGKAETVQSFLDWKIGMSVEEAINLDPEYTFSPYSNLGTEVWYRYFGPIEVPFQEASGGTRSLLLKFVGDRLVQIQVEFSKEPSVEACVTHFRSAVKYLSDLAEVKVEGKFEGMNLTQELVNMTSPYVYQLPERPHLSVHARYVESVYLCSFSIMEDGEGSSMVATDSDGDEEDENAWPMTLPGAPDKTFGKRLSSIHALLVRPLEEGDNAAAAMKLSISAFPDRTDGKVEFSFNQEVGEDMTRASREVVRSAQLRHGIMPANANVQFGFADKWGGKDGPSAAVACALLLESLLSEFDIPENLAVTGDLNADGTVQPVGGVADKVRGALAAKCDLIGIPRSNAQDIDDLVVEENLRIFLTAKIFTLSTLDQALKLANAGARSEEENQALADFTQLQADLAAGGATVLFAEETKAKLQSIQKRIPNFYSADILLRAANRQLPQRFSLAGTLTRLDEAMAPFANSIAALRAGESISHFQDGRGDPFQEAKNRLRALSEKSDERLLPVISAEMGVIGQIQSFINANIGSQTVLNQYRSELKAYTERSASAWKAVRNDREIQDQLMKRGINLGWDEE